MDEKKKVDKIEKIKELLKDERIYKKDSIIASYLYRYVKNLKIGFEKKGGIDLLYKLVELHKLKDIVEKHDLLAVSPVFLYCPFKRKHLRFKKMFDEILNDYRQTIFIDLDERIFTTGSADSSGKRSLYDLLSVIFEKKEAPTLIPILFGKKLFKCYFFKRFIGNASYHGQDTHKFPEELTKKGYKSISKIIRDYTTGDITIYLHPEKKEIKLLKFY